MHEIGLKIGEYLGAIVDSNSTVCHGPTAMGIQEAGKVGATEGQKKNRGDLIVYWGTNPLESMKMDSGVSADDSIFKMADLSCKVFESSIDSMAEEDPQAINKIVVEAKKVSQFGFSLEPQDCEGSGNIELSMVEDAYVPKPVEIATEGF